MVYMRNREVTLNLNYENKNILIRPFLLEAIEVCDPPGENTA